jgi:formylglycine-generating enzyme required for sulfatase activity
VKAAWIVAVGVTAAGSVLGYRLGEGTVVTTDAPLLGTPRDCAAYSGLPRGSGGRTAGMVRVPAGNVEPGSFAGYFDERPDGVPIRLAAFWIDRTEVTNAQFAAFVAATGHVTEAERQGGAAVFRVPPDGVERDGDWWQFVRGADWRHPDGPASDLRGREHEPVVQVTFADAQAYAHWLGRELPTEAQWEYAARAGGRPERLERQPRDAAGRPQANFWQGIFPELDTREDGYAGRSPVGCFAANGWGLHDMIGNVWEWTRDDYRGQRQPHSHGDPPIPAGLLRTAERPMVVKGGSFLCSADYCARYRASARHPQESRAPAAHLGFRTVVGEG